MKNVFFPRNAPVQEQTSASSATTEKPASLLKSMFDSLKSISMSARENLQLIDAQVSKLREQREKLETAPPHCDDLAEWVCRNIDLHREYFFERAATYLHPDTLQKRGWSAFDDPELWCCGFSIFRLDNHISAPKGYVGQTDRHNNRSDPIDPRGLIALLAEPLKAGARDFILRLLPESENGMRRAERDKALATIDSQLAELNAERHDILDALRKAGEVA